MAHNLALSPSYIEAAVATEVNGRRTSFVNVFNRLFARKARTSEVERFILANGGTLTDSLEREISRRYGHIVE